LASANLSLPEDFSKIVRLFPLPNLVLFPRLVQALHIFEPRYRSLMNDALESDQLISMALLQPQAGIEVVEPIFATICIGKVVTHVAMPDGRFNLILAGICRARIVREIDSKTAYRMAEVELPQEMPVQSSTRRDALRDEIVKRFRNILASSSASASEKTAPWLDLDLSLGHLCDLVAFACNTAPVNQQQVLEAFEVERRAEIVLELLKEARRAKENGGDFPPEFSLN
jgi:uncharacterized protein